MKFLKTLSMAPLVLGLSSDVRDFARTGLYNEIDILNENNIPKLFRIGSNNERLILDEMHHQKRFDVYYNSWIRQTTYLSNVKTIISNRNFQQIISMGELAIPLILRELSKESSCLVWALNLITNKRISESSLSIDQATNAWLKWGRQVRYI